MPPPSVQPVGPIPEVTPPAGTISAAEAVTLAGLFRERARRTPQGAAYRYYDPDSAGWRTISWQAMWQETARWRAAMAREGLERGDRVAIMMRNCREWVMVDQATLGLGMVLVPLYTEDRADNVAYILQDAGVKLLVIGGAAEWAQIKSSADEFHNVIRIVSLDEIADSSDPRLVSVKHWLPGADVNPAWHDGGPDDLATIVYTSGTTGRPKGVMLSHRNILSNAWSGLRSVVVTTDDLFLSFLPLSHSFERTVGYYLPMMAGAVVAHTRGVAQLGEDLQTLRPTGIICVPRIFERIYGSIRRHLEEQPMILTRLFGLAINVGWRRYEYRQGRRGWRPSFLLWPLLKRLLAEKITSRFGGRVRIAISGGAALSPRIGRAFIGLGVPILQGYGLTEASPVVSVNRPDCNIPESIGPPLPGVEVKIGPGDELLVRGELIMLGYWKNPEATRAVIDAEHWLHTGDKARIEGRHLYITGRLKDIIVLANGEKVPPGDMELAIETDHLFEQVMIIGESRPYLSALAVLNEDYLDSTLIRNRLSPAALTDRQREEFLLERIARRLKAFPGYAQVHRITCVHDPWTVENDLLTPTLKIKRDRIRERYAREIEAMYEGHSV